jgi:phosphatidate phosphatase APP1
VVGPHVPYLLVSDFDDTVAVTNVRSVRRLLANTFLRDAETQPVVPGMAALYRSLTATGAPLAFVSGSPVQLASRIGRFLGKHEFPRAALYLRNIGPHTFSHYKEPVLAQLSERFPGLPLVLIGDSGERDPEIFGAFIRENPDRVLRAYVRRATVEPDAPSRFEGQLLFTDPAEAVADAMEKQIAAPDRPARKV